MAKSSIAEWLDRLFLFYRHTFLTRPFRSAAALIGLMFIYLLALEAVFPERFEFFRTLMTILLRTEPKLEITIRPTERYEVGTETLMLKRVTLHNKKMALRSIRISIRVSEEIAALKVTGTPQLLCDAVKLKPSEGGALFEVSCPSLVQDQQLEMNLVLTRAAAKGNVVVEAVGAYGRDRFVGASAAGTLESGSPLRFGPLWPDTR